MLKGKSINPHINIILSHTGHTDLIGVVDAGFPITAGTERVDLAWTKNKPGWLEICSLIKEEIEIEKIYLATEIKEKSPEIYKEFVELFKDSEIEFINHSELKEKSRNTRAIIRTGEYTSFCNCIFVAGVTF
jgi:D-ribose pyranase